MMAALPDLNHFSYKDEEHVYPPSEDTYLLCDGILQDLSENPDFNPNIIVEVGCGSGCVIVFASQLVKKIYPSQVFQSYATDINPKALDMAMKTASANEIDLIPVQTDLLASLEDQLAHNIDILIFNPPYVPTSSEEIGGCGIAASWAGGVDGREVTDRFLPKIDVIRKFYYFMLLML
jgi:release factor glutamine methyltransferase